MRYIFMAFLSAAALAACDQQPAPADGGANTDNASETAQTAARSFIGTVHGLSLPAGVERTGWVLLDSLGGQDYAVTAIADGARRLIWLDQSHQSPDARDWEVVGELAFASLPPGHEIVLGTCTAQNHAPAEIVAHIERAAPGAPARVLRAWHVNRQSHNFDELRAGAVVCR